MKILRAAVAALALLVVLALAFSLLRPAGSPGTDATAISVGGAADAALLARLAAGGTPEGVPAFHTGLENLPSSLADIEIDGALRADASGRLVVDEGVRRLFDWFLSALGEESLAVLVARLHAYFDTHLPPGAAAEARALLAGYLGYRDALAALDAPAAVPGQVDITALRQRQAQAQALRSGFLSADAATAFYAAEDAWDSYALDRMAILQDDRLAPAERATQLAALHDALPPALQETVKAVSQAQDLALLTEDWQQRGGNAAELRQLRENLVGAAAADRLEALDAERAAWDERLAAWLAERDALLRAPGLSAADRDAQLATLRGQHFNATERVRVAALEALHDGQDLNSSTPER